jgi:hypothetical protein
MVKSSIHDVAVVILLLLGLAPLDIISAVSRSASLSTIVTWQRENLPLSAIPVLGVCDRRGVMTRR